MRVSVNVSTKDIDAALAAFKKAFQSGAIETHLSSNEDYETKEFTYVNLTFEAEHSSDAISSLDDGPFSNDPNDL